MAEDEKEPTEEEGFRQNVKPRAEVTALGFGALKKYMVSIGLKPSHGTKGALQKQCWNRAEELGVVEEEYKTEVFDDGGIANFNPEEAFFANGNQEITLEEASGLLALPVPQNPAVQAGMGPLGLQAAMVANPLGLPQGRLHVTALEKMLKLNAVRNSGKCAHIVDAYVNFNPNYRKSYLMNQEPLKDMLEFEHGHWDNLRNLSNGFFDGTAPRHLQLLWTYLKIPDLRMRVPFFNLYAALVPQLVDAKQRLEKFRKMWKRISENSNACRVIVAAEVVSAFNRTWGQRIPAHRRPAGGLADDYLNVFATPHGLSNDKLNEEKVLMEVAAKALSMINAEIQWMANRFDDDNAVNIMIGAKKKKTATQANPPRRTPVNLTNLIKTAAKNVRHKGNAAPNTKRRKSGSGKRRSSGSKNKEDDEKLYADRKISESDFPHAPSDREEHPPFVPAWDPKSPMPAPPPRVPMPGHAAPVPPVPLPVPVPANAAPGPPPAPAPAEPSDDEKEDVAEPSDDEKEDAPAEEQKEDANASDVPPEMLQWRKKMAILKSKWPVVKQMKQNGFTEEDYDNWIGPWFEDEFVDEVAKEEARREKERLRLEKEEKRPKEFNLYHYFQDELSFENNEFGDLPEIGELEDSERRTQVWTAPGNITVGNLRGLMPDRLIRTTAQHYVSDGIKLRDIAYPICLVRARPLTKGQLVEAAKQKQAKKLAKVEKAAEKLQGEFTTELLRNPAVINIPSLMRLQVPGAMRRWTHALIAEKHRLNALALANNAGMARLVADIEERWKAVVDAFDPIAVVHASILKRYAEFRIEWLRQVSDAKLKALEHTVESTYELELPDYIIGIIWDYVAPMARLLDLKFARGVLKAHKENADSISNIAMDSRGNKVVVAPPKRQKTSKKGKKRGSKSKKKKDGERRRSSVAKKHNWPPKQ